MQIYNYLSENIDLNNSKLTLDGMPRGAVPLVIDHITKIKKSVLIITSDPVMTDHLERELSFYNPTANFLPFPDWETLPYDSFSPHSDIISQRISTLNKLSNISDSVTCIPLTTSLHKLCPVEFIKQHSFCIKLSDKLNLTRLKSDLIEYGYENVIEVNNHGEFCIKGSIIDIYPMGSYEPYRIDLFDDEVDSIRVFDPETQKSFKKVNEIELLPAHEFSFNSDAIRNFKNNWRDLFHGNPLNSNIYNDISENIIPSGIEYFIPLFFEKMSTIFDYLAKDTVIVVVNSNEQNIDASIQEFIKSVKSRYENYNIDSNNPLLPVEKLYLRENDFFEKINQFNLVNININNNNNKTLDFIQTSDISIDRHLKNPVQHIIQHIEENKDYKYLFTAETSGRQETIINNFSKNNIKDVKLLSKDHSWQEFLNSNNQINLGIGKIDYGFTSVTTKTIIVSESELFGNQVQQRRLRKHKNINTENIIQNLIELKPGQYVVHEKHGIGKYMGLETINVANVTNEYIHLLYADNSKLYVPVTSLDQISRYSGLDEENIHLNKLGNKSWSNAKTKALKKIQDTAADLLAIYAKRAAKAGHEYKINQDDYNSFCANFKFEETPDQELAISQVLTDMKKTTSMDRLVCGDVGFGKTEVALRAAFIAATNNKQVAMLVPTTLLAQQHYENFKDRFSDFAINIELLSRFRTSKESMQTLDNIKNGKVDIVIGTHKLLQESVNFKDLGLLIIDEEHRFGVTQKEKIKKLRSNVDILTLTATPIPRTLNLSLTGIRDLSIITTPPQKRLAIKTFLHQRSKDLIVEAIAREIKRGGQVYFLHNNVKTIDSVYNEVTELFPDIKAAIAHGQMRERELERIMSDFYHRKFQILICTTIIETGIDIPSANTILIDRADKLGLAQLHQIRGRVGRSHHQAYAYLFTPNGAKISKDAHKRLEAITSLENLGAGFTLASHDMEIRGTGNLLGDEQSGHIETIGYNLYMDLLNKAIKALKSGEIVDIDSIDSKLCEVDLKVSALLPDDYVHNVDQRLIIYKRISTCETENQLEELKCELIDRFGKLPEYVENLFITNKIKLTANKLNIIKIDISNKSGKIKFGKQPKINQSEIIKMIQTEAKHYKLSGQDTLSFSFAMENVQEKYNTINNIFKRISA